MGQAHSLCGNSKENSLLTLSLLSAFHVSGPVDCLCPSHHPLLHVLSIHLVSGHTSLGIGHLFCFMASSYLKVNPP